MEMHKKAMEFLDRVGGVVEESFAGEEPETVGVWDAARNSVVYAPCCLYDPEEGTYVPALDTPAGRVRCDYDEQMGEWRAREKSA